MDTNELSIMKPAYRLMAFAALCLALTGCASDAPRPLADNAVPGLATLTSEARTALDQAETEVALARAVHALWTTAEVAIGKAREAAQAGDSAKVLSQAKIASDHARLGLAQKDYPSTEK
jgi:hypothetical protein